MTAARLRLAAAIGLSAVILILIVLLFAAAARIDLRTIERDNALAQVRMEQQAHAQTVKNYRAAATFAQQAADRNVARVTAEQAAITKGTVHDYQARLAAVDARLRSVRAEIAARPDLRGSGLAPMSIASEATCRAY